MKATENADIVPQLLTTIQAARLCNVGTRTLWRWSRSGIAPPPLKIGYGKNAAVRYQRSQYEAWIAGGCKRVDGDRRSGGATAV